MTYVPGGGSSGNISGKTDVALNNPSDEQVLAYDGALQKWVNVSDSNSPYNLPSPWRVDARATLGREGTARPNAVVVDWLIDVGQAAPTNFNYGSDQPSIYPGDWITEVEGGQVLPTTIWTWDDFVAHIVATGTGVVPHRVGGARVAKENAVSTVDFALAQGTPSPLFDGGDMRSTSDGVPVVVHNTTTGGWASTDVTVSTTTLIDWKALKLLAFPERLGVVTTEAPATAEELFTRIAETGYVFLPETKDGSIVPQVVEILKRLGLENRVNLQSFKETHLTAARNAGFTGRVGLLQNANNNIGASAIMTSVAGAKPDLVGYDPRTAPGNDSTWIQSMISAGIKLQAGTYDRRLEHTNEIARIAGLGGQLLLSVSDNPYYIAKNERMLTSDRFAAQNWEHGIIRSTKSNRDPFVDNGWLRFDSSTQAQWALMGAFGGPVSPQSIEVDIRYDTLDSTASRWVGIFFNQDNDAPQHDGNSNAGASAGTTGDGYMFFLRQTGELNLGVHINGGYTALTTQVSGGPSISAGSTVRVRVGIDATGRPYGTRLDSGHTITATNADATYRGGYWSIGKFGSSGSTFSIRNILITP